jgi:hypothetical protein
MVFPAPLQYAIKERLPRALQDELLILWYAGRGTFKGRRAFAVLNNEVVGAIRLSVKGRDRDGLVNPGAEYLKLRDDIHDALMELTDPATGRPVVASVSFLHDRFEGPYLDQLPDLTVFWDSTFHWSAVHSPRFGTLQITPQDRRSGSHTASSFLLARGPGVPQGAELEGCTPLDVVASVLDTAGVAIPANFDGAPLPILKPAVV